MMIFKVTVSISLCLILGLIDRSFAEVISPPIGISSELEANKSIKMSGVADALVLYTQDCGVSPVGRFIECTMGLQGTATNTYHIASASYSGSPHFSVINDGCQGATINATVPCYTKVRFDSSVPGEYDFTVSYSWTVYRDDEPPYVGPVSLQFFAGSAFVNPPPRCSQELAGSIIRADGQTLSEEVALVGMNWSLFYSSEYASSFHEYYIFKRPIFFGLDGWNFSLQHFYSKPSGRLYRGTGSSVEVPYHSLPTGNIQVINPLGNEVFEFDSNGRHLKTLNVLTGSVKYLFSYHSNGTLDSITDAYGNLSNILRNASDIWVGVEGPYGDVTTISHNSAGLVSSITNPKGESYTFTYKTGTDLMDTFTKPGLQTSSFTYDADGKLLEALGNGGNLWSFLATFASGVQTLTQSSQMSRSTIYSTEKNAFNNYIRTSIAPFGQVATYTEFSAGNFSVSDGVEETKDFVADDERFGSLLKRKTSVQRTIGSNTRTTSFGQNVTFPAVVPDLFTFDSISKTQTTFSKVVTEVYNAVTKTFTTTSPMGVISTSTVDNHERPVSTQLGTDTPWVFTYDTRGRISSMAQGSKNSMDYTYGTSGNLQKVTNARSEETLYSYDLAGRLIQVTLPDLRTIGYQYDANGKMIGITPYLRPQHSFSFNAFELMSAYEPPALVGLSVKDTLYSYNNDKQLTQITRPDGQYAAYGYGATTGLLESVYLGGPWISYSYMPNSNLIQQVNSSDDLSSTFGYFGYNLAQEGQYRSANGFRYALLQYGYDSHFRVNARYLRGNANTPVSTISYSYNNDDQPTLIGDMGLAYSATSGRLLTTVLDNISDVRTYDTFGYLQSYTATYNPPSGPPQVLYSYTLTRDVASRISSKTETILGSTDTYVYTFDTAGRLTDVTKNLLPYSSYVYDSNGNRVSGVMAGAAFVATYDEQDRLLTHGTKTYTYSANGDVSVINYGSNTKSLSYDALGNLRHSTIQDGRVITYGLDGNNRRVLRRVNGATDVRYIYVNSNQIAAHLNGSGVISKEYVYGVEHTSPDYMIRSGFRYRIIKDHLGSPRLAVKTDDGTVTQRLDYTDFGRVTTNTNSGFQHYGFAGGIYDDYTRLVKFGARDYDPETGRWTSKDPIGFAGEDTNLYGYVQNDPVNWIDPSGLKTTLYNSGIHQVIAIDNPSSPTGKTYIDLVPGNSSNIGIISPSPASIGVSSTYIGNPLSVAATYNTSAIQETELLNMAAAYNMLAQMGIYNYQTLTFGGGNVGNCRTFADDLLRGIGAK